MSNANGFTEDEFDMLIGIVIRQILDIFFPRFALITQVACTIFLIWLVYQAVQLCNYYY